MRRLFPLFIVHLLLLNGAVLSAASITLSGAANGSITFDANDVTVYAQSSGSSGSGSAIVSATGVTQGPVRMGVLEMFGVSGIATGNGTNYMQLGAESCQGWGGGNADGAVNQGCRLNAAAYQTFELGVSFAIGADASFYSSGQGLSVLSFALFEGTVGPGGTTATLGAPVAVFDQSVLTRQQADTPEPGSALLLGTGLSCLLAAFAVKECRLRYAASVSARR